VFPDWKEKEEGREETMLVSDERVSHHHLHFLMIDETNWVGYLLPHVY